MAFKESTANGFANAQLTSVNALIPANTIAGDLMILFLISCNAAGTVTIPSGWSEFHANTSPLQATGAASVPELYVYTKVANTTDESNAGTGTYTWTSSGNYNLGVVCAVFDPAELGDGDVYAEVDAGSATTSINAPSVNTSTYAEHVIYAAVKDGAANAPWTSQPSADYIIADLDACGATSDAGSGLQVVMDTKTNAGPTGTKTFTLTSNEVAALTFTLIDIVTFKPIVNFF